MKARTLDPQVKVYSSMEDNSISIAELPAGTEIEFGAPKRKAGKQWVPITLSTGQLAYISGSTRLYVIRKASTMQKTIDLRAEPSAESMIKQSLPRGTQIYILEVLRKESGDWVRVRDMAGMEGFIPGDTRIRVVQQRTKAMARKNLITGVMWLVAGMIILFSGSAATSGGSFAMFGYLMVLYGAILLIWGGVQFFTAPM